MHQIKAIFFDLDGTVIDPITHTIPASTIQALNALARKGTLLFVATGRSYHMLEEINGILELPWSGFVCSNGQCIFDKTGKLVKGSYFKIEQIEALLRYCKEEEMVVNLVSAKESIAPLGVNAYMVQAHDFFHEPLPVVVKPYVIQEDIYMALIYNDPSYNFHNVEQIPGLRAFPNQSSYADVVLDGVSKASGIAYFCEQHQIAAAETMAFGDGGNDIDMLKHVAVGIAMGNASEVLKQASDYITDAVDADGIPHALLHFNLLTKEDLQ